MKTDPRTFSVSTIGPGTNFKKWLRGKAPEAEKPFLFPA